MDIGSLYNVLIGAMIKQTSANMSTNIKGNIGSNVSFGDILEAVQNKDTVSAQDMFSVAFSDYSVKVKSGDRSVSSSNIQSALSKIGYGQMAVIIPDELREKMEADPKYAWEIVEKVQKYKEDYDKRDNTLAATYGYNSTLHQMSKSYCISLDEKGDVKTCWVTGGGLDSQKSSEVQGKNISKTQNSQQVQQTQRRFVTTSKRRSNSVQTTPLDTLSLLSMDTKYLNAMSYFNPSYAYNDILKNL